MSEQDGTQAGVQQRPATNDQDEWKAYWKTQGQSWRTEPEISSERQAYLAERRRKEPNMVEGIYPLKNVKPKLSRADVEWLLASHENGGGPVDWQDERQRGRPGLDLRAANLRGVDLRNLPLACLHAGLTLEERKSTNEEQWMAAGVMLEEANLREAQLQGATLCNARLQGSILRHAHLQHATLIGADLQHAGLSRAKLQGTNLRHVQLQGAFLADAVLGNEQQIGPYLADAHLENANLAVLDWSQVSILADEYVAQQKQRDGKLKATITRLEEYRVAARANRQLAVALQTQGLNEEAKRFVYRAQCLERRVFWFQRKFGQYLFSLFLDLLAGYGYRLERSLITYLLVIAVFATIYHLIGTHLAWNEAIVISMTAFHGRGFFPDQFHPGDPQALVAALEAFVGLLIEVTLIATLTQRLFGK